jgi:hypothetical protein
MFKPSNRRIYFHHQRLVRIVIFNRETADSHWFNAEFKHSLIQKILAWRNPREMFPYSHTAKPFHTLDFGRLVGTRTECHGKLRHRPRVAQNLQADNFERVVRQGFGFVPVHTLGVGGREIDGTTCRKVLTSLGFKPWGRNGKHQYIVGDDNGIAFPAILEAHQEQCCDEKGKECGCFIGHNDIEVA